MAAEKSFAPGEMPDVPAYLRPYTKATYEVGSGQSGPHAYETYDQEKRRIAKANKKEEEDHTSSHEHFVHKKIDSDYYRTHGDIGKTRYGLTPGILFEQVGKVMTNGFDKYKGCTWKETPDGAQRYTESFLRHAMQVLEHGPGARDDHSGDLHLAHAACDAGLAMWHLWKEGSIKR